MTNVELKGSCCLEWSSVSLLLGGSECFVWLSVNVGGLSLEWTREEVYWNWEVVSGKDGVVYPSCVDVTRPGEEEYFSYKVVWSDAAVWAELLNAGGQWPGKFDAIP